MLATDAGAHDVRAELALAPPLAWGAEPWVLACLALSLSLYLAGIRKLWLRSRWSRGLLLRQAGCFGAGWTALALALASPLDPAGSYAFSAHMVQHEVMMAVSAPLMVLGRPLGPWLWALPAAWRRRLGSATRNRAVQASWAALSAPLNAWLLHFAALWMWHVPSSFQAALADNGIHALQHASFLVSALLFWWAVLGRQGGRHARGAAIAYLFTTMIHTGVLGALLTLSSTVWYPIYGNRAQAFGLSPLDDQQLGGLIMWVPGGLVYMAAALALCLRWMAQGPRRARAAAR